MATYNRTGAIEYAKKWWDGHNPNYVDYDNDNVKKTSDCANFVSQCMYEGGGMPMKYTTTSNSYDSWYYKSSSNKSGSWAGAQSLRLFVKYNKTGYPRMGCTFLSEDQISKLQPGDLVFELEGSGNKSSRKAKHVAMVSSVEDSTINVYAHSVAKGGEPWGADLEDTIFCHFDGKILENGSSTDGWKTRYGTSTLKASSSYSSYVKNLQTDLISLGYDCGTSGADGYFGSKTTSAVKSFQTDEGLTVDGLAGNATKQALYAKVFPDD